MLLVDSSLNSLNSLKSLNSLIKSRRLLTLTTYRVARPNFLSEGAKNN